KHEIIVIPLFVVNHSVPVASIFIYEIVDPPFLITMVIIHTAEALVVPDTLRVLTVPSRKSKSRKRFDVVWFGDILQAIFFIDLDGLDNFRFIASSLMIEHQVDNDLDTPIM